MYSKLFKQIAEQQNVFSFFFLASLFLASRAGDKFLFTEFEPKTDFYKMCAAQNPKTAATTTTTPTAQQRQLTLRLCVASNKIFSKIHKFCWFFLPLTRLLVWRGWQNSARKDRREKLNLCVFICSTTEIIDKRRLRRWQRRVDER